MPINPKQCSALEPHADKCSALDKSQRVQMHTHVSIWASNKRRYQLSSCWCLYDQHVMSIWSTWGSLWSTRVSVWLIWLSIGSTQESIWSIQASTWSTQESKWPNWMSLRQCECLHIDVGVSVSTWVSICICNVKVIIFECFRRPNHSKWYTQ